MAISTQLHQAIDQNATERLIQLLEAGTSPNDVNGRGDTALHCAAAGNQACAAALLLAHGADWRIPNAEGKAALGLDHINIETLHRIRQAYHRLAAPPYRDSEPESGQARAHVRQLRREGLLRISGMVTPTELRKMKAGIRKVILRMRFERLMKRNDFHHYDQKEYWQQAHRAYVYNDALAHSDTLVRICCNPVLVETAHHYLGKKAHIKRVYGMRYLPKGGIETQQFGWHNDMEDRMLKVMILLTDLTENDQYMTYVRGSHNVFHPYPCFLENKLSFEQYCMDPGKADIVKTLGKAGDLFLFDPNGMHRGNRCMSDVRDALFIEYTADGNKENIWGSELAAERIDALAPGTDHPLKVFKGLTPKWERVKSQSPRQRPTWAETLEDPENWLRDEDKVGARARTGGESIAGAMDTGNSQAVAAQ